MESKQKGNYYYSINSSLLLFSSTLPTTSIITGEKVNEKVTTNNVEIIEKFVETCNYGKIEEAYNMLTDGCKEALYPTVEKFCDNYYNIIFKNPRTTKIENYKNSTSTNTYIVTLYEDIMATGSVQSTGDYKDYITVEKEDGKLNINSLITSKSIKKESEKNGISIKVLKQEIYLDYETYEFEFKNNTENTIMLDTLLNSKTIYLLDRNNIKYSSFAAEVSDIFYELSSYETTTFSIRFNKRYNPVDETKKIGFSDIILNYEQYKEQNTKEREKIEIDL